MSTNEPPQLGNTSTDIIANIAKGATGAVPIVGSLIAEVVGNIIPNQRVDRIVQFVQQLEKRLGSLEQEVLRNKLLQPEAVDLLEDAFSQAARATSQERIGHIANVVANGLSEEELKQTEAKRMLWLLGQLNDSEVIILRSELAHTYEEVDADADFRSKHAELLAPDVLYTGLPQEEFEKAALKQSYQQRLHELGLLRYRFRRPQRGALPEFDENTGMMKATGSQVTTLGEMLLRYLNLIPDWHSN